MPKRNSTGSDAAVFPSRGFVKPITMFVSAVILGLIFWFCSNGGENVPSRPDIDPTTLLWYTQPADKWDNALPVGNGRLGAMVFGRTDEERIQLNEDTFWSGGPYNQTVEGSHAALPEIQKLIFSGKYIEAHKKFGRYMMGNPVEQMKYQSFANLVLSFTDEGEVSDYRHQLDLANAVASTSFKRGGVTFQREVFVSAVDQVIMVRLTADKPGVISFTCQLQGCRNTAHSNYGNDYFQMDGFGDRGLKLTGKSADYLGVNGALRYEGRLQVKSEGGTIAVAGDSLHVSAADSVILAIAAATSFNSYKDVSGNPGQRVSRVMTALEGKSYRDIKKDHVNEHRQWFDRVSLDFGSSPASYLPTDSRISGFNGDGDPNLAALAFQFGRYLLIASSRPGTQPANLQGIWNEDMNPSWDSKYTTNINTEMNYWPAEVANLSELSEPLVRMISELSDQGSQVAREHYGASGWVFHQNTDIWRVAAPMDGPDWGAFTTGGTWLCTHLWEHYLYTGDRDFLASVYPLMKGNVAFFLDFLVEHPRYGWLVTNPSTSPENFPAWPGNDRFFDEVAGWMSPGTTLCAGSTIDMQLLYDFFSYFMQAADILGENSDFVNRVADTRERLAPMQIGAAGDLQEWLEDWPQKEGSHRHISNLYGLFPGNRISLEDTPELARACEVVLEQRGLIGNGWASAWKMASWARLYNAAKALENFSYYLQHYTFNNLFSICQNALQVDGTFGVTAAIAEMLLQSHRGELHLLPALPAAWSKGTVGGLRARGGFELGMQWQGGRIQQADITSLNGNSCRVRTPWPVRVTCEGKTVQLSILSDEKVEFSTEKGKTYHLKAISE